MISRRFTFAVSIIMAGATLASPCAHAQSLVEAALRLRFTSLSKSSPSGLASDHVRGLAQDVRGLVWIATSGGLNSFDGWETALHQLEIPGRGPVSTHLTSLATTREDGPVWIGTADAGLVRFDHATGEVTQWRFDEGSAPGLPSDAITDLAITGDEILWIGTERGLARFNLREERFEPLEGGPKDAYISFVSRLGTDDLWVGTIDGHLLKWQRSQNAFQSLWAAGAPISAVTVDSENRLWIGTSGRGLFSFDRDRDKAPVPAALSASTISSLFFDSAANLWVGTPKGLALRDREEGLFTWIHHHPRRADSLADNRVTKIYEDRSRMLWVATEGGGTSRFHLEREWFPHIRSSGSSDHDLPDPVVRSISRSPEGLLWIGTDGGLTAWDPSLGRFVAPPVGKSEVEGISVGPISWDEDGVLWIGTRGEGLVEISVDGIARKHRSDPARPGSILHDMVSALRPAADGNLLVGTIGGGLMTYSKEDDRFDAVDFGETEAPQIIFALAEDRAATIWVASEIGIFLVEAGTSAATSLSSLHPTLDLPATHRISTILPDANGIVWVGTMETGLDQLNLHTGERANFNSAVHGLPDDEVRALAKDRDGFLWVATRTGLSRLQSMRNEFRVFSPEDGLLTAGFTRNAASADADGLLYFGGQDGFNVVNPSRLPSEPRTPTPVLTSFEYFGERVVSSPGGILEKELAATDLIRLPYDPRTRFSINFGSLDYRALDRGHFRYMLEGHDIDWTVATEKRSASYASLRPGDYRFLVQSSVDGIDWADFAANVRLRVAPPWWQSWWFLLLSFGTLIGAAILSTKLIIRSRTRQLRQREQQLTSQRDRAEAELARQLQNHMLVKRAAARLHSNVREEDQVLNDALARITEQFGATHCLVYRLESIDVSPDQPRRLRRVGYFSRFQVEPDAVAPSLRREDSLVAEILSSGEVVACTSRDAFPESVRNAFGDSLEISALAAKTSFLDTANGIILFLRVGSDEAWSPSEIKLLEALSGQFGIAIAQLDTAATEERYRRHLEEARHEAEVANRAKSDFLAKMTHELRTPLNAIIGFSEILGSDPQLNERQRETLEIINNSGEHLLDVINEILDLSKIEAGKMELHEEAFLLVPLLKSVYEMLSIKAEQRRIGFKFFAKSRMPVEVLTDRSKLRQILINLLGNAIKFTAQGAVGLSVNVVPLSAAREVELRHRRRVRIEFEVRDTGRGIREEEIPRLFERYSQTESGRRSSEGTGLGLPIARSFVQLLGGDVEVESVVGEGTVFRFCIECDEQSVAHTIDASLPLALDETSAQRIVGFEGRPGEEVRILIAEDQPTNRLLLKKILGKAGFSLAEAVNGVEAVEKWREWHPHLILMDEDMPEKRGSEATREIKAEARDGNDPVIVSLTAYALSQVKEKALEAGCSDFVAKPFRAYELFAVISKHLGLEYRFNDAA